MPKASLEKHPINQAFKGFRMPSRNFIRKALLDSTVSLRIDDLKHGGQLAADCLAVQDFSAIPASARGRVYLEIPQLILRYGSARPHIIKDIAKTLFPKEGPEDIVELYSGGDLSGPMALSEAKYVQVSRDPFFAGLNELPKEFFERIGLPNLKDINLAHNFRWLTDQNIEYLTKLAYFAFPKLDFYFEDVETFAARNHDQFDLGFIFFFPSASIDAALDTLKLGGRLVYVSTPGYQTEFAQVRKVLRNMKKLETSKKRLSYDPNTSLRLSRRLSQTPGYDELGIAISVFKKVKGDINEN